MILLKARARGWRKEQKKPASELAGRRVVTASLLEGDLAGEEDGARRAIRLFHIAKTVERASETRIFNERINATEIRMVEGVQEAGVELKVRFLAQFNVLDDREVRDIRDLIPHRVARRVAERRAEHPLRSVRVDDEAHVFIGYRNHFAG